MAPPFAPWLSSPAPALGILLILSAMLGWWIFESIPSTCEPKVAESALSQYRDQGIQQIQHPPSLSNLLWVMVGPEWHGLSQGEKDTIDRLVRCAATTTDQLGEPTWQAAYYDSNTGKLVALTSRKYGFRLEPSSNR